MEDIGLLQCAKQIELIMERVFADGQTTACEFSFYKKKGSGINISVWVYPNEEDKE